MINEVIDEIEMEHKKIVQAHVRKNYLSRIIHIGCCEDEIYSSYVERNNFNDFIDKYGKDKTYYALINSESSFVLVNLSDEEPVSKSYKI